MSSPIRIGFAGPEFSRILVVGDCPTADDEWRMKPFAGGMGEELRKMLHEAGLLITEIRFGYLLQRRPNSRSDITQCMEKAKGKAHEKQLNHFSQGYYYSDAIAEGMLELAAEIQHTAPTLIIALGEAALWALTGESGITSWRGSLLPLRADMAPHLEPQPVVLPTYAPASIQRVWEWRSICVRDLSRASAYMESPESYAFPDYRFSIRPDIGHILSTIAKLHVACDQGITRVACDIETIARHISCIGIAWSPTEALCIPLLDKGGVDYWSLEEEVIIYAALKDLLTHPNCWVVGQNFAYDRQHFAKHLGYQPNLRSDTMIAQHLLYPGMPKSLDFISSMYAHYHRYWKDELKDFNKMPTDIHEYWTYNCKDCVITWEVSIELERLIEQAGLQSQYAFQMRMLEHVNTTMLRGVRIDSKRRSEVAGELLEAICQRETMIQHIVGFPLNVGSPKQMKEFLYDDLGIPVILNRKTKQPTCDDEALQKIAVKEPLLRPLIELIAEKRSLGVFLSTFCMMPLDTDGRMRTSYNIAGTETFRFNSSENAFGSGGNLQNIPKGEEK
jgi:uracil-DNA glycosylase